MPDQSGSLANASTRFFEEVWHAPGRDSRKSAQSTIADGGWTHHNSTDEVRDHCILSAGLPMIFPSGPVTERTETAMLTVAQRIDDNGDLVPRIQTFGFHPLRISSTGAPISTPHSTSAASALVGSGTST